MHLSGFEVHKRHPTISKVTVYRNLRQLADDGFVRKIMLPEELERYDKRAEHHYHFKCKNCGALLDVDVDYLKELDETVRRKHGFILDVYEAQGIKNRAPTNKAKGPAFKTELATAYPECRLVVTKESMTVEGMIKIVYDLLKRAICGMTTAWYISPRLF